MATTTTTTTTPLVIRQLIPGRGGVCEGGAATATAAAAVSPARQAVFQFAAGMANCMYVVGDATQGACVLVDPCWDVEAILKAASSLSLKVVGVVLTHYHFDHTGGVPPAPYDSFGVTVEGVADVVKALKVPVYVGEHDAHQVALNNGIEEACLRRTHNLDLLVLKADGGSLNSSITTTSAEINLSGIAQQDRQKAAADSSVMLRFIHTPGHTPGGQCVLVNGTELLTGDTVFANCCGRVDFPDCDPRAMWQSLRNLATLPGEVTIWPGHDYGGAKTSVQATKQEKVLSAEPFDTWLKAQL